MPFIAWRATTIADFPGRKSFGKASLRESIACNANFLEPDEIHADRHTFRRICKRDGERFDRR